MAAVFAEQQPRNISRAETGQIPLDAGDKRKDYEGNGERLSSPRAHVGTPAVRTAGRSESGRTLFNQKHP